MSIDTAEHGIAGAVPLTTPAALPEEIGIADLGLWNGAVGAYRGWSNYGGVYRFWTADNALMLWAYSKPIYAHSRQAGYAVLIRDYLMDMESNGLFSEGKNIDVATGQVSLTDPACSATMETQVLWGIIAFTKSFPGIGGRRGVNTYRTFISRVLANQHRRVMAREMGKPCSSSGNQSQHSFDPPATVAFHILNAATWYKSTGDKKWNTMAREAWSVLRQSQVSDGSFSTKTLRNSQVLYCITEALRMGINPSGMKSARDKLASSAKQDAAGALYFGKDKSKDDTDTQGNAYHFMSLDKRPFSATTFLSNRLCSGKGYAWKGKGGQTAPGPVEDQALGLLGPGGSIRCNGGSTEQSVLCNSIPAFADGRSSLGTTGNSISVLRECRNSTVEVHCALYRERLADEFRQGTEGSG